MGQQNISLLSLTFTASGTIKRRRAIGFNGAYPSASGQKVLGVSPRDTADKSLSDVIVIGTAIIETGGAFAAGASLISDGTGCAIVAAGTAGEFIFADALEASSAAGSLVEVLLRR